MRQMNPLLAFAALCVGLLAAAESRAQSSSLYGAPSARRDLTLMADSWTFQKPAEPVPVALHDIVTVVINESSVVISDGLMDRRKDAKGDLKLTNWIFLKGLSAFVNPMVSGEPEIAGTVNNKMRSQASLETRDSMKFRLACTVVDIRPNGNLVLEGRRTIQNNDEIWEYSLTGEVRARDILPNNQVQSENVAEMRLDKREAGHVRDGYRRGWLLKLLDNYQPF